MPASIMLEVNELRIPAILNDTVAAIYFKKRIPFTVLGHRSDID